MAGGRMRWALGILAMSLWVGAPCLVGQQQPQHLHRRQHAGRRHNTVGTTQSSSTGAGSTGAAATNRSVPQSGTPTLEHPRPAGKLGTLPNQTLTPGATTVPSNAGGIAPASNAASSGEYTPSEGTTAPVTPGGNPSQTEGVPTFSSPAQPPDANLPRTVSPRNGTKPSANSGQSAHRAPHRRTTTKPRPQ
jgi:hypothetical protein